MAVKNMVENRKPPPLLIVNASRSLISPNPNPPPERENMTISTRRNILLNNKGVIRVFKLTMIRFGTLKISISRFREFSIIFSL